MAAKKPTPLQKLEAQRDKLQDRIDRENEREIKACSSIGFYYGSRAYARLKHLSFSKGAALREKMEALQEAIAALKP